MGVCLDKSTITSQGQLNYNQDGTISVFMPSNGVLAPVILNQQCCLAIDNTFVWDANTQKCLWSENKSCSIENAFNITLNPNGNDGVIFTQEQDKICSIKIDFDFLLKIKCETLNNLLINSQLPVGVSPNDFISSQIAEIQSLIDTQTVNCEYITEQIAFVEEQIALTNYSVPYQTTVLPGKTLIKTTPTTTNTSNFSNTGFPSASPVIAAKLTPQTPPLGQSVPSVGEVTLYCITQPDGLNAWANILGPVNYQLFLNGDPTSFTQEDVQTLLSLQTANGPTLIFECETPFGTLTNLLNQLDALIVEQTNCQTELASLNAELNNLISQQTSLSLSGCAIPINMLETIDVSMSLNVLPSTGGTVSVYEDTTVFPAIGYGMLYDYLTNISNNTNLASGFYITNNNSTPLLIDGTNDSTCSTVLDSLLQSLYSETPANLFNSYNDFVASLPNHSFASDWLHHTVVVDDQNIISAITNQKITISLNLNHTCGDVCILLDNVKLDRECSSVSKTNLFVTQSPGFELEKIRDNKKSWLKSTSYQERPFDLRNTDDTNPIRITNYDVNDERLVINTKEIDLDISLASAIETDIWCYIINNPCILTGETYCDPCAVNITYKQYQDGIPFEFEDGIPYDFMDETTDPNSLNVSCCGDNLISFDSLMTQPLTAVTTVEDFEYFLTSELIDAKNRQTISGYATLRALYDRYLNSEIFCGVKSSGFDYLTIDQFAGLVGNYWVDIIEQVIPSTTIWGSVKIYSNTLFDQQKFKYKGYSSLFCNNPFIGEHVVSPINGTNGFSANIHTDMVTLTPTSGNSVSVSSIVTSCDEIWVAQMNSANEFIGTVSISGAKVLPNENNGSAINECTLQVEVIVEGLRATANVTGAENPVAYYWSNGGTDSFTYYDTYGSYSVTVIDKNGCSVTVDFEIPLELTACWYTLPDDITWMTNGFNNFGVTDYTYTMDSMIVNESELVVVPPSYALTSTNLTTASTTNVLIDGTSYVTYTNFVDFLNTAFASLGLTNYSAQLSYNRADSTKYNGFYIIRPLGDSFSISVSETNGYDVVYTDSTASDATGPSGYRVCSCDGITIVNGQVVE